LRKGESYAWARPALYAKKLRDHDALDAAVSESRLRKVAFDDLQIVAKAVELAQMPIYG
jgi:hypothetical protein